MLKRGVCVALLICGWTLDAAAAIAVNPSPLDAGTALLFTPTSADGTLTSTTNDHVDLEVTNSCTGTGLGNFSFATATNINLNAPATISVTYTPSARGTRTCRVDVKDTGTNTVLGSFNVRGTGIAPPTMSSSGTSDFGAVRWNNAAPTHTSSRNFTVSNGGDQTLDVTAAISGANAADFTITTGGSGQAVAPGGARTWTITFDPSAGGVDRTATLTFSGNDPSNASDSFTLVGDGTNAVISLPATVQDYGIINTGSTAPLDLTITNTGGAPKGNLGVTSATITDPNNSGWFSFGGSCSGASCTFSPALAISTTGVATVRCSPAATAAAGTIQTATVTFTSDTDNATANSASLRCTAGKSSLATNQAVVTFSPQLVASTTTPNTITVSNTGNVATTYYLTKSGTNQASFSIATPTGCGLTGTTNQCPIAAMGTSTFTVTFTPGLEGDISAGVTIVPAGSTNVQVTLTGRGIDRHIQMIDALQFPDTFRNPGDMATVMPVTVKNIGEYPLHVSSVLLDGAPNWVLAEPFAPFDVPGLGSVDINVKFQPVTAGKAPDGVLAVMSDDPKASLLNVIIAGNGKDRNVAMPGPIEFGNTGAGVPINLTQIKPQAEWLTVINMDDTKFKIRAITFDIPEFKVQTLDGDEIKDRDLPAGESQQFEIVFLPPKVGDYTANMTLFLDQDPQGQHIIEVHGNALFVDAHGGGGCSTGHGAGAGMLLALGALLRRKRRRD